MSSSARRAKRDIDLRSMFHPLLFISLVLALPFGIGTSNTTFRDGDTSWQVAAGEWILHNGRIPTTDPFSFTAAGQPWVAMEWLSEIVFALAFRLAGYAGLIATVAASLIALHAIIFFYLQRRASTLVIAATLLMLDFVLAPLVLARPLALAWPLLAGWTVLLLRFAEKGRPPPLWSTLILVAWTNLHASFPLAIPIAGAIGLDALIKARWTAIREWALFGAVSVIALALNANGVAGLLQPFRTSTLDMLPSLGEWHRSSPHVTPFFFAALVIAAATLLWFRVRAPIGQLLLLLAMLAMALAHVRHQSVFIIVAACVLPPIVQSRASEAQVPWWLILCALPLLACRAIWPLTLPESRANPRALIAAAPAELRSQPVFNSYIFGGPLILNGIRPYVDGRAEIYGDAFVQDYVNITNGDMNAFNRAVQRYDIRWTMLSKSDRQLVDAIESSGSWKRIYADHVGVIDVRRVSLLDHTTAEDQVNKGN